VPKGIDAQEYLNEYYPKEIRSSIRNLYLREKKLKDHLDLSDFENLERLDCSTNNLTSLKLSKKTNLIYLDCQDNQLTDLDFASLNQEKLV